ncbi:hypothetical protein [Streptomyces viridochromogenes]|uniref:hypothetical protein n=1 Tax=Streptomyces viridochromogenes TaxID=1938 RepID=UPI000AA40141|nr:hypothetical protein [Streptomyces viridochromogenes]
MYAVPQRHGHTKAVSGPVLLALRLRRAAAVWVRRLAGADTAGTGQCGVREGAR